MSEPSDTYHVKIEESANGGFVVSLTGPNIPLVDVELCDTREECHQWAETRAAWRRDNTPPEEYTFTLPVPEPQSIRA